VEELLASLTTALEGASARVSKVMDEFVGELLENRKASSQTLVFGKPVDEVLRRESSNLIVPVVVYKVVAFLSKDGVSFLFFYFFSLFCLVGTILLGTFCPEHFKAAPVQFWYRMLSTPLARVLLMLHQYNSSNSKVKIRSFP
jgi:hypothetical protein